MLALIEPIEPLIRGHARRALFRLRSPDAGLFLPSPRAGRRSAVAEEGLACGELPSGLSLRIEDSRVGVTPARSRRAGKDRGCASLCVVTWRTQSAGSGSLRP